MSITKNCCLSISYMKSPQSLPWAVKSVLSPSNQVVLMIGKINSNLLGFFLCFHNFIIVNSYKANLGCPDNGGAQQGLHKGDSDLTLTAHTCSLR